VVAFQAAFVTTLTAAVGLTAEMRVLIAEDDRKTRAELVKIVSGLGCDFVVASSGLEAIKQAQETRPDVLLLDGLLPEMHGFEIARIVRKIDPSYHPRIVVVTGVYKSQQYREEAMSQFDVDGYIVKPFKEETVAKAIFGDSTPRTCAS